MNGFAIPFPINDCILDINVKVALFHNIIIKVFTDIFNNTNFKDNIL